MKRKNYPNCQLCSWSNLTNRCTAQGGKLCEIVYANKHCFKLYTSEKLVEYNFKKDPKS